LAYVTGLVDQNLLVTEWVPCGREPYFEVTTRFAPTGFLLPHVPRRCIGGLAPVPVTGTAQQWVRSNKYPAII